MVIRNRKLSEDVMILIKARDIVMCFLNGGEYAEKSAYSVSFSFSRRIRSQCDYGCETSRFQHDSGQFR